MLVKPLIVDCQLLTVIVNKNLPALIIGLVALIAIISGVVLYQNSKANSAPATVKSSNSAAPVDKVKTAPPGASPAWSKGAPNAVVTLEEFADFECPSCSLFQPILREVKTVYGDRVRFIFRQYPLQMHKYAGDAARAAEASGAQGKFWEMHDLIYEKQKEWSKAASPTAEFENYAKTLGLNLEKFKTDMTAPAAIERVAADKKRGDFIGIRATPSVFLNGRLLTQDEMQVIKLRGLIESALQGK